MINKTDILVVGSGMMGLTTALALADSSYTVSLVAPTLPEPSQAQHYTLAADALPANNRVSAINQASINAFKQLGVWPYIQQQRFCAYQGMDVWDKDNIGRVQFHCQDVQADNLGCIIENDVVTLALWQALQASNKVTCINASVSQINSEADSSIVVLDNGTIMQARLVIAADGANSQVRKLMNMPLVHNDYDQQAIVATIKTEKAHDKIARQAFTANGPLALLPLYDDHLCSIVYSQQTSASRELMALNTCEFAKRLTAVSDSVLGQIELVSERQAFPLRMRYSRDFIKDNVVLIGDAAHTIHPLAGQGANLGLMDALAVSECVIEQGFDHTELSKTLRWRKSEAFDRIAAMETFHRGFTTSFAPIKLLRGLALQTADTFNPLKQLLIKEAMGTVGKLPALAQASAD
ncbi:FAD-dependent 2-octaprenylphenol hydroxylase [Saccharobesus litoralis]|uniref:FAD-dependent 2-octaprenylphenol hydroxylase n=1 Tax=Saccharobesus litoralis TaxID=2172099 RepID=A0A2S0VVZ3_9ALTE|nr:UbiH/UbiF/VisC/COQ6 family ubiquinone biosynthesis hydroxylase [Saccharobesus litoralis]AWB68386.1 FAD-dependent 2-octaprenylphenol hydroxylase [Saccharobesus litoralis]